MSDKAHKRTPRLGRGLSSLMGGSPVVLPSPPRAGGRQPDDQTAVAVADESPSRTTGQDAAAAITQEASAGGLRYLAIESVSPNPHQPRQRFDERTIAQLAASIKADGLVQPIVVRPAATQSPKTSGAEHGGLGHEQSPKTSGGFEIVAGERRWRAARAAGLERIPAIVRELDDRQAAEWSLIENLQREDLNPIDRAEAFKRLCEQYSLSHDQVAQRVGLERSTISNLLRLLNLAMAVRDLVRQDLLSMGQARAIAGLESASAQETLANRTVREGLSVREVERLARQLAGGAAATRTPDAARSGANAGRPAYLRDLEKQLAEQLGTKVQLTAGRKKGAGKLTIEFYSLDQFDAILGKLGVAVG